MKKRISQWVTLATLVGVGAWCASFVMSSEADNMKAQTEQVAVLMIGASAGNAVCPTPGTKFIGTRTETDDSWAFGSTVGTCGSYTLSSENINPRSGVMTRSGADGHGVWRFLDGEVPTHGEKFDNVGSALECSKWLSKSGDTFNPSSAGSASHLACVYEIW